MRLCISFTSAPATPVAGEPPPVPDRLLHARMAGEHYGVFDVYFDTLSPEQIVVGKTSSQNEQVYYDLWMSFAMRSLRKTPLIPPASTAHRTGVDARRHYRQQVHGEGKARPPADLSAEATLDVEVKQGGARIVLFELSRYLQMKRSISTASRWSTSRTKPWRAASSRVAATTWSRSSFPSRSDWERISCCASPMPGRCYPMRAADCYTWARAEPGIPTAASL